MEEKALRPKVLWAKGLRREQSHQQLQNLQQEEELKEEQASVPTGLLEEASLMVLELEISRAELKRSSLFWPLDLVYPDPPLHLLLRFQQGTCRLALERCHFCQEACRLLRFRLRSLKPLLGFGRKNAELVATWPKTMVLDFGCQEIELLKPKQIPLHIKA